jgi:hypothetical protein
MRFAFPTYPIWSFSVFSVLSVVKLFFAFASRRVRRVAVVNVFESVYLQPGRLKIKRVSIIAPPGQQKGPEQGAFVLATLR